MNVFGNYTFAVIALGSGVLGAISGIVGSFAVLRRQSLLGDGVSHAALPGVVAAFMLTGIKSSGVLLTGALVSGLAAALLISYAAKKSRLKFDAALASVMSAFFGLGTVLLTCSQKNPDATQAGLSSFIYGQASSMMMSDVILTSVFSAVLMLAVLLLWKELKVFCFDKDFAVQLGYSEKFISLALSLMTVAAVILGIRTVGVVLMSAMITAPAAAARQWSDRLWVMVLLSAIFGSASGALGAYVSAVSDGLPTGPAIVITVGLIAIASLLFAPKRGIIKRLIIRKTYSLRLTVEKKGENIK